MGRAEVPSFPVSGNQTTTDTGVEGQISCSRQDQVSDLVMAAIGLNEWVVEVLDTPGVQG